MSSPPLPCTAHAPCAFAGLQATLLRGPPTVQPATHNVIDSRPMQCAQCGSSSSPVWRRDTDSGVLLCSACGMSNCNIGREYSARLKAQAAGLSSVRLNLGPPRCRNWRQTPVVIAHSVCRTARTSSCILQPKVAGCTVFMRTAALAWRQRNTCS